MGLIEKKIRNRGNQKLAAPLSTTTHLSPKEVQQAVKDVCATYNQAQVDDNARRIAQGNKLTRTWAQGTQLNLGLKQYYFAAESDELRVSYERPPAYVLANAKRRPGVTEGYWLAVIRIFRDTDAGADSTRVQIHLSKWVINSDGKMGNKDKYEHLTNLIWEAVSSEARGTMQLPL